MAGVRALIETDAKKIVALSTLRQLGIIIMAVSAGLKFIAFFHLISHAFFKALLFIVIGNIIHLSKNYQDLRIFGNLKTRTLKSAVIGNIANLRLCGLPFMSGFYSKDL